MAESRPQHQAQYRGWLYKWTNYLRGYQKRWFVLQNGLLSYYRNQAEMAHTCRGTINLANAFIHTEDSNTIVISNSGSSTYYLKATSEVERQKWVTALELAKAEAVKLQDSESDEEEERQPDKNELQNTVKLLMSKLEDMKTCNDLIAKHGSALQRALSELESMELTANAEHHGSKAKVINERATMFRITSNAMINACTEYLEVAQSQTKRIQRLFDYEHEQRVKLEDMVEQLAKEQVSLEVQAKKTMQSQKNGKEKAPKGSDDEDFFDALDYQAEEFEVALPHEIMSNREDDHIIPDDRSSNNSDTEMDGQEARVYSHKNKSDSPKRTNANTATVVKSTHKRNPSQESFKRTESMESAVMKKFRRPLIPPRPNYSLNLWSIMKNCIGKELSKIPMPVNFNEPLSMLQRLSEDFEYSRCLDRAAESKDSAEELAYLAAFTISAYSTTTNRSTKPFNPLLGETFECDRTDDYGWKSLAEQVSHHPPTAALYTEGRGWKLWQEFTMASKFRGKYLQIIPLGTSHAVFKKSGNHYTWRKVTTTVHNIIVGKLWVDNHGEMDIVNHTNGDKCHLKFSTYSYFSRDIPRKVTGVVTTKEGEAKWVLTGTWDKKMEGAKVIHVDESNKGKPVFETGPHVTLWEKKPLPPGAEKMYFFTRLAIELNEPEEGVAPTDSRLRPDQRLMEDGKWDEANRIKVQLEDKQRTVRKKREAEAEEARQKGEEYQHYTPTWFTKKSDPITGSSIHVYNGLYWDCKQKKEWTKCPNIYL